MSIKMTRAIRRSNVGRYPRTCSAMIQSIPASVYQQLTSAALADLLDALYRHSLQAKALHERDIVSEGCVWDDRRGRLLDLAR